MILSDLKLCIEQSAGISRRELAKKFAMSEDGVDAMLSVWIKKGKISRFVDTNSSKNVTRIRYAKVNDDALALNVTM
ncbi:MULTISPECIES: FeoC-like transcriptional regulator [Vibrio]|uniref:FeoC-like transcriptional regulator n=1 Tax=Vibrio bivalvicida TaxID=1276888 RepID=A0A177XWM9_9VIBR|nr:MULTISPECIES: FeoC-like transcriptional regulator [Vibrio]KLN63000.1 iron transporter FeoC [Vibrio sp. VPAP30]OAJ92988.1 iron transporter FeoC [Vibrio bivalvicida]